MNKFFFNFLFLQICTKKHMTNFLLTFFYLLFQQICTKNIWQKICDPNKLAQESKEYIAQINPHKKSMTYNSNREC